jgi:hypothetical protein
LTRDDAIIARAAANLGKKILSRICAMSPLWNNFLSDRSEFLSCIYWCSLIWRCVYCMSACRYKLTLFPGKKNKKKQIAYLLVRSFLRSRPCRGCPCSVRRRRSRYPTACGSLCSWSTSCATSAEDDKNELDTWTAVITDQ